MKIKGRRFTKDEIKKMIQLWETKTIPELAEELDRSISSVHYISKRIRVAGYDLPKKNWPNSVDSLIKEVLKEL